MLNTENHLEMEEGEKFMDNETDDALKVTRKAISNAYGDEDIEDLLNLAIRRSLQKRTRKRETRGKRMDGVTSPSPKRRRNIRASCCSVERPYSCELCGRAFKAKFNLQKHERSHTGEKPFACAQCGKTFSAKVYLQKHELTHSAHRPFGCDVCDGVFKTKRSLKMHKVRHSGVRPFVCGICGKDFPFGGELRAHERAHRGEKPFTCEQCGKAFSVSSNLRVHERSHRG